MSQNLTQLCALLIEEVYGPFLSEIFSDLTTYGRLPANNLAQRSHLPLRQVRSGLGVLIQLRLVYHHTAFDGRTTYEANPKAAYSLMRTGRLVQAVQQKFGYDAARIIKRLAALGQASVSLLETEVQSQPYLQSSLLANGANVRDASEAEMMLDTSGNQASIRQLLQRLSKEEYIIQVRDCHFQTWSDVRQDAEHFIRSSDQTPTTKGKQAQQIIDDKIEAEMSRRSRASLQQSAVALNGTSLKRSAPNNGSVHSAKRPRVGTEYAPTEAVHSSQGHSIGGGFLDKDLVLCVNFGKSVDALRDEQLSTCVARQSGTLAGHVCAGALLQLQGVSDPSRVISDRPVGASDNAISQIQVNADRLLLDSNALDFPTLTAYPRTRPVRTIGMGNQGGARLAERNGHINGHSQSSHHAPITPECIDQQLQIISEGETPFIFRSEATGTWTIDANVIRIRLLKAELFHYVRNRFGLTALRIIRILTQKGKVDEKWLQEIGLLSAKDLRQSLANLHSNGFIELQEVPREPQRQPNRTMFLWFFDLERAQRVLLDDTYKCMARLLQRIKLERQRLRSTLSKVERSDVKGKEEILLAPDELSILKQWRSRERWLLSELGRLDDTVLILRDV